jgi:L-arabinonolactonase
MRIDVLVDVKTILGEGPLWDVQEQRLYWIDIMGQRVFRCTADGREVRAWDVPGLIGSMAIRENGGALVSLQNGFHFLDFETGECARVVDPEPDLATTRLNDGKVDRQGRFLCGSLDMEEKAGLGALYRLDPDLSVHKLESGIVVSNGPCWSPDGRTFYFHDSLVGDIWAYDYDVLTGTIKNRRIFVTLDRSKGFVAADGSTVDAEGYLWNSQIFGGKLVRYAPDGSIDREIPMPVKRITSVMFGGPNLDILYVTSMAKHALPELPKDGVMRGSLFAVHGLGVCGLPERRFAG